ncbi:MAG: hypothetical protein LCH96_18400 [Actinobacteria bacterium]|nr:hypothetical protein [Actinomycetota bacterium]
MSQNSSHRAAHAAALGVSFLLTCAGLVSASAPHAAAVSDPPCTAGTPLASDFDGDGTPELVAGGERFDGLNYRGQQHVQTGTGDAGQWLTDTDGVRSADLNGDVCADAVLFSTGYEPSLRVALGTPGGLDLDGATTITIPQAADIAGDDDRALVFEAGALRHHGISQVVISGHHTWDDGSERYGGYIDFLTLDPAGVMVTGTQVFSFPGVEGEIIGFGVLATSGGTAAIGVPSAKVSGHGGAGAVRLYTPDTSDPTQMVLRKVLTQNSSGVPGSAEAGDGFGGSLSMLNGRLAIGVPGEADGSIRRAGLVQPIVWHESSRTYTAYRAITQDTKGVPDKNDKDDVFGTDVAMARGLTASGSYDILIGAEDGYGSLKQAGSVTVANFTKSLYRTFTQASAGVPGNSQAYDHFAVVGVLPGTSGVDTVLIGSPGEDSNGTDNVGRVIRSDGKKLGSKTVWTNIDIAAGAPSGLVGWGLTVGAQG